MIHIIRNNKNSVSLANSTISLDLRYTVLVIFVAVLFVVISFCSFFVKQRRVIGKFWRSGLDTNEIQVIKKKTFEDLNNPL